MHRNVRCVHPPTNQTSVNRLSEHPWIRSDHSKMHFLSRSKNEYLYIFPNAHIIFTSSFPTILFLFICIMHALLILVVRQVENERERERKEDNKKIGKRKRMIICAWLNGGYSSIHCYTTTTYISNVHADCSENLLWIHVQVRLFFCHGMFPKKMA